MNRGDLFFIVFIFTILLVRTGVFLFPENKLRIFGTVIHHFFIGIILIFIALLLLMKYPDLRFILFSVGLGVVADEFFYMILGAGPVSKYWDVYSLTGVVLNSFIVFLIREKIAGKI